MNQAAIRQTELVYTNQNLLDDEQIKKIAKENRAHAFELVVHKYREKLFQHALYLLKDAQEAIDATQETLIRAYQEPAFFEADFKIRSWLFRVITNLSYNITRDKRRRGGLLELLTRPAPRESEQALDEMLRKEEEGSLSRALERVPEKYRSILLLKYYNDLSYLEIADVLGCKLGTVMSRLSRAREKLQSALVSE
ncbi:MAG: RNA polymerase sigma factor [Myxococcota bacterium]